MLFLGSAPPAAAILTHMSAPTHTLSTALSQSPAQQLQSGKFYYKDGSTYEGQYKVLGLAAASATEAAPAKKPAKKPAKEDDLPAQPAEPPKPVRHGIGEQTLLHGTA